MKTQTKPTLEPFHVWHSCGHHCVWLEPINPDTLTFLTTVREFPCPWCGAETGHIQPPDDCKVIQWRNPLGIVEGWVLHNDIAANKLSQIIDDLRRAA